MPDSFAFVSDLHVAPGNKDRAEHFGAFIGAVKQTVTRLYILGDLFDYWIGRGHEKQPEYQAVLQHIRNAADSGLQIFLLHGNRDFLLNSAVAQACGARIVGDSATLHLAGKTVYLCHGDQLCERDRGHQSLRRMLRSRIFRAFYGVCPFLIRYCLARTLRTISEHCVSRKSEHTTALSDAALLRLFAGGVDVIVCGHTHSHGQRVIQCGGTSRSLYNLGDWSQNGSYLLYTDGEFKLLHFEW